MGPPQAPRGISTTKAMDRTTSQRERSKIARQFTRGNPPKTPTPPAAPWKSGPLRAAKTRPFMNRGFSRRTPCARVFGSRVAHSKIAFVAILEWGLCIGAACPGL